MKYLIFQTLDEYLKIENELNSWAGCPDPATNTMRYTRVLFAQDGRIMVPIRESDLHKKEGLPIDVRSLIDKESISRGDFVYPSPKENAKDRKTPRF